jgi:hypothetical protein
LLLGQIRRKKKVSLRRSRIVTVKSHDIYIISELIIRDVLTLLLTSHALLFELLKGAIRKKGRKYRNVAGLIPCELPLRLAFWFSWCRSCCPWRRIVPRLQPCCQFVLPNLDPQPNCGRTLRDAHRAWPKPCKILLIRNPMTVEIERCECLLLAKRLREITIVSDNQDTTFKDLKRINKGSKRLAIEIV